MANSFLTYRMVSDLLFPRDLSECQASNLSHISTAQCPQPFSTISLPRLVQNSFAEHDVSLFFALLFKVKVFPWPQLFFHVEQCAWLLPSFIVTSQLPCWDRKPSRDNRLLICIVLTFLPAPQVPGTIPRPPMLLHPLLAKSMIAIRPQLLAITFLAVTSTES